MVIQLRGALVDALAAPGRAGRLRDRLTVRGDLGLIGPARAPAYAVAGLAGRSLNLRARFDCANARLGRFLDSGRFEQVVHEQGDDGHERQSRRQLSRKPSGFAIWGRLAQRASASGLEHLDVL